MPNITNEALGRVIGKLLKSERTQTDEKLDALRAEIDAPSRVLRSSATSLLAGNLAAMREVADTTLLRKSLPAGTTTEADLPPLVRSLVKDPITPTTPTNPTNPTKAKATLHDKKRAKNWGGR